MSIVVRRRLLQPPLPALSPALRGRLRPQIWSAEERDADSWILHPGWRSLRSLTLGYKYVALTGLKTRRAEVFRHTRNTAMDWIGILLLLVSFGIGLIIIPFGLPGVAVIFVGTLIYGLMTDFRAAIGINFFIVLCALTVVAETADNWLMVLGAKKYGASTGAIWLSFLGGALGGLLLGPLLAVLLGFLGPFLGVFVGGFLAVLLYEYYRNRQMRQALRAAWGAFLGRMAGILLKMMIGVGMAMAVAYAVMTH
jgi:uncharacterized protein